MIEKDSIQQNTIIQNPYYIGGYSGNKASNAAVLSSLKSSIEFQDFHHEKRKSVKLPQSNKIINLIAIPD